MTIYAFKSGSRWTWIKEQDGQYQTAPLKDQSMGVHTYFSGSELDVARTASRDSVTWKSLSQLREEFPEAERRQDLDFCWSQ